MKRAMWPWLWSTWLLLAACGEVVEVLAERTGDTDTHPQSPTAPTDAAASTQPGDTEGPVCDTAQAQLIPDECAGPQDYDCHLSLDGEAVPRVISCADLPAVPYCDVSSADCSTSGCVDHLVIRYDFAQPVAVTLLRFLSDWHSKRPVHYELWASDTADTAVPADAVRVLAAVGQQAPWVCTTGDPCTQEVPDACCPNGRDNPQDTVNVGDMYAKWDMAAATAAATARHWYFVMVNSYYPPAVILREVELWGHHCP